MRTTVHPPLQARQPRARLEVAHDVQDSLAGAQQHVCGGHLLHHRHLLVHDPEKVHRARRPQPAVVGLLGRAVDVRLGRRTRAR